MLPNVSGIHTKKNTEYIYIYAYLVTEWKCLLFAKVKLLGIVVNDLRLRKPTSLMKETRKKKLHL